MKILRLKTMIACILLVVVLSASGWVLFSYGIHLSAADAQSNMDETLDLLLTTIAQLEEEYENSEIWFRENMDHTMLFMKSLLETFVSGGQYTGPRTFEDGMVIELRDGKAVIPEAEGFQTPVVNDELISLLQASKGEAVCSRTYFEKEDQEEDVILLENLVDLYGIPIGGHFYYLNWTTYLEEQEYVDLHNRVQDMLHEAETAFGGAFLILDFWDQENVMQDYSSSVLPDFSEIPENVEKLSTALIDGVSVFALEDEQYIVCSKWFEGNVRNLVFLIPYHSIYEDVLFRVIVILALLFLFGSTLIAYLYFIQAHNLLKSGNYSARKVLQRILAAGLAGAILLSLVTAFVQAVGSLHQAMIDGQETLEQVLTQVSSDHEKTVSETTQEESEWFVYYGELMACIFSEYPELATSDLLQDLCDILQIDYIMLFNSSGKETVCNKEYSNFTLGTGQGQNGSSFRRLLQGVDAIVQPVSYDETTNLTRQYIGVSLPDDSRVDPQGVLIMALLPDQTDRTIWNYDINEQFSYLSTSEKLYYGVSIETGEILFGTCQDYIGSNIDRFGLGEESLKGGYMGSAHIEHNRYYVVTVERDGIVYDCFMAPAGLFRMVPQFTLVFLLCYAVLYALLSLTMLIRFAKRRDFVVQEAEDPQETSSGQRSRILNWTGPDIMKIPWSKKNPREKSFRVFKAVLLLLIIGYGVFDLTAGSTLYRSRGSLFRFIFLGDWMHGINLFSFCAILLLILLIYLITSFVKWMFRFLPLFFGSRGETIERLLSSLLRYIAILVAVYFSLDYLGLRPSTILAGLGIAGLAITMGAKDMITDIFAGISIIFEGAFQVGDIIRIGKSQGEVQSIGIRMTRIKESGGNIRILNNKDITDVVNLTQFSSWASVSIRLPKTAPFEQIRRVMERELAQIGENNPDILSCPSYMGITGNDEKGDLVLITIVAECVESRKDVVSNYLYEESLKVLKTEEII